MGSDADLDGSRVGARIAAPAGLVGLDDQRIAADFYRKTVEGRARSGGAGEWRNPRRDGDLVGSIDADLGEVRNPEVAGRGACRRGEGGKRGGGEEEEGAHVPTFLRQV